jgi:putative ABC transport system substrate-binding protein
MILCLALIVPILAACDDDDEDETLTPTVTPTPTPAESYKIGITQIVTHPALDANKQGFIDKLAELGFVEGENVEYIDRNPEGDMTLAATIAQQFVAQGVDLIHSIATPTSQACVAATEGTDIPVLFGSVTDPVAAGLITDWERPGENVTGVSDWLEFPNQIQLALDIMPDIKKVGVVYNAGETNSVVQVDAVKANAPSLGIEEVVEATAATTADVMTAGQSLVGRVDAIWVGTDNTVVAAFEALVKVCEDNDIPLFASDVDSVDRGAVAALGMDYYEVGLSCGEMAARILGGENAGDIPAQKIDPADLELWVNPGAAERMGITIPQDVLDTADQIVEETAE